MASAMFKKEKEKQIKKTRKTYCSNIASVGVRPFAKHVISFQEKYYEISVCSMFEHQTDNKDVRIYIDSLSSIA